MARRSLRNLFARPATRRYPFEVRPPFDGARGTIEFDLGTCVFCNLCARRCPAVAITCSREERYFAIDQLRCIACGVCADVCNKGSLTMSSRRREVHALSENGAGMGRPGREEWHGLQLVKPAPAGPAVE
jgi:ech hydrogenase subunit F